MSLPGDVCPLPLDEFPEHFFWVDGDESTSASCQNFIFFVQDLSRIDVLTAVNADFPALDVKRFVKRDGLEIFDGHLFRQRNDVVQFIYFAHGVVEDRGNNAAVAMAGRPGVALAQFETADKCLALVVQGEFQAHAVGIILSAGEAVILLQFDVVGFVAMDLAGHGRFYRGTKLTTGEQKRVGL